MNRSLTRFVCALLVALATGHAFPGAGSACFGARLRVGVDRTHAIACYAVGYYVEEKTGVEPEFVDVAGAPTRALMQGKIDVFLALDAVPAPAGLTTRPAGDVPGLGPARFWIRPDVLDDLRFFTVDRALGTIPEFYASDAYRNAHGSGTPPKKAARQAVLRAN